MKTYLLGTLPSSNSIFNAGELFLLQLCYNWITPLLLDLRSCGRLFLSNQAGWCFISFDLHAHSGRSTSMLLDEELQDGLVFTGPWYHSRFSASLWSRALPQLGVLAWWLSSGCPGPEHLLGYSRLSFVWGSRLEMWWCWGLQVKLPQSHSLEQQGAGTAGHGTCSWLREPWGCHVSACGDLSASPGVWVSHWLPVLRGQPRPCLDLGPCKSWLSPGTRLCKMVSEPQLWNTLPFSTARELNFTASWLGVLDPFFLNRTWLFCFFAVKGRAYFLRVCVLPGTVHTFSTLYFQFIFSMNG